MGGDYFMRTELMYGISALIKRSQSSVGYYSLFENIAVRQPINHMMVSQLNLGLPEILELCKLNFCCL